MTLPIASRSDERLLRAFRGGVALAVLSIGWLALLGWLIAEPSLTTLNGTSSIKISTAASLILLAACDAVGPRTRRVFAALVALVCLRSAVAYLTGAALVLDDWMITIPTPGPHPGRMAATTAVCLLAVAVGTLAQEVRPAVYVASGVAIAMSSLAVLGHLYGVPELYTLGPYSVIALPTALCCWLLGVTLLFRMPGGAARWLMTHADPGAVLLRRLVPVIIVGLPVLGFVRLAGEKAGWYDTEFGLALMVSASATLALVTTGFTARSLSQADRHRREAQAELVRLNAELDSRVRERARQLTVAEGHKAILSERQRIAADLHDHVIQGLFAAGMRLTVASRTGRRVDDGKVSRIEVPEDSLLDGVAMIDEAIGQLRASIFKLHSALSAEDLHARLTALLDTAADVIPERTLSLSGDLDALDEDVTDNVLAAAREAVSNAARHAGATTLHLDLSVVGRDVVLSITDNGVGLDAAGAHDRRSGLRNLADRAQRLGGFFSADLHDSPGTALTWSCPLEQV